MPKLLYLLNNYPRWVLTILTLAGLWCVFGPAFFSPNDYLLSASGDGLKAYYATGYFIKYIPEGVHHSGFQYPYGNHLLYLDANPLLTLFLRFLSPIIDWTPYLPGLITLSIMISFFICAYLVFAILRRCLLPIPYSILSTLVITFFSPQIVRFAGHYALSYLFFVPLLWYLLIRYSENRNSWKWMGLYILALAFFSFIHPYYFLIGFAFLWATLLVDGFQGRGPSGRKVYTYTGILAYSLLPVLLLKGWEYYTYTGATDAVKYPYGFLTYIAGFESIFLPPQDSPFWYVWNAMVRVRRIGMEGYGYVGFTGLCILLFTLIRATKLVRRKKGKYILRPVLPNPLKGSVWAATLLLIPAMAYPFQLFPAWADSLEYVRQFRSLGRIVWIFYYVYMVFCVWVLYAVFRKWKIRPAGKLRQLLVYLLIFLAFSFWGIETYWLIRSQRNSFLANPKSNLAEQNVAFDQLLHEKGVDVQQFQAILSLPFYHHGSEKLFLHNWISSRTSMAVSLDTGLPLCNNLSSRVPLSYTLDAIQLVSHPALHKELPVKFPNSKPLLLLYQAEATYRSGEALLISRSDSLAQWENIIFARLDLNDFSDTSDEIKEDFLQKKPSLIQIGDHWLDFQTPYFYFNSFGDRPFSLGESCLFLENGTLHLFKGRLSGLDIGAEIEVSFWVKIDRESNYLPALDIIQSDTNEIQHKSRFLMQESYDIFGDWVRVNAVFPLLNPNAEIILEVKGKRLTFDNLMIKPASINIYTASDSMESMLFNNYFIGKLPSP